MSTKLHWISDLPIGRMAIMPRPRAGDWLVDEMKAWKAAGVDLVVSLLSAKEVTELGLQDEPTVCQEVGLQFESFPITDRGVPDSIEDFVGFVSRRHEFLHRNVAIAIHCRMGIGRSSVVAACLLVKSGCSVDEAFRSISRDRGMDVPDTAEQIEWVRSVANFIRA